MFLKDGVFLRIAVSLGKENTGPAAGFAYHDVEDFDQAYNLLWVARQRFWGTAPSRVKRVRLLPRAPKAFEVFPPHFLGVSLLGSTAGEPDKLFLRAGPIREGPGPVGFLFRGPNPNHFDTLLAKLEFAREKTWPGEPLRETELEVDRTGELAPDLN